MSDLLPPLRTATIEGRHVSWREAGQGPALVLVHGIGGHSGSWRQQFLAFSPSHRVIAWDAPGYGQTDALLSETPSAEDYARLLADFLAYLGVGWPHLVGHSLGSIMITAACHRNYTEASSLTLLQPVAGSGDLPSNNREPIRLARIADMERLGPTEFAIQRGAKILSASARPDAINEAIEVMKAVPKAGYLAAWEMMCRSSIYDFLDSRQPALVICGADDPVCPPTLARSIADKISQSRFHCFERVGHYASIEAAQELNALLADFLHASQPTP